MHVIWEEEEDTWLLRCKAWPGSSFFSPRRVASTCALIYICIVCVCVI